MTTTTTGFPDLPRELCLKVYAHLGVPEVCRVYINCPSEEIKDEVANYLRTQVIQVTAEPTINGDGKIDFATYARLFTCDIHVTTSVGFLPLTKQHLNQVEFDRLALAVTNEYGGIASCDLRGLHGNVTSLNIQGNVNGKIIVDVGQIPGSVTNLSFCHCALPASPSFARFTNLTHFCCCNCNVGPFTLPPSITNLIVNDDDDNNMSVCDASLLTKLKHVAGNGVVNFRSDLLETARLPRLPNDPQFDQLQQIVIAEDTPSFKGVPCPKLERVEYGGDDGGGDVTELFTEDQLGRLTLLGGQQLVVVNMDPLCRLQQLHMKVDEPMTTYFPLPPRLSWLTIYSSAEVDNIPSQVRHFKYVGLGQAPCDVTVASPTLTTLIVTTANTVTVDCPTLTTLELTRVNKVRTPQGTPYFDHTSVSLVANRLSSLNVVTLSGFNDSVVIDGHLKSIKLHNMGLRKVQVSADEVDIDRCTFFYGSEPPTITARVLTLACALRNVENVVCQELRCRRSGYVSRIPAMVEKLTFDVLDDRWRDLSHYSRFGGWDLICLAHCHQLRMVAIVSAEIDHLSRPHVLTVPPSVTHFVLYQAQWGDLRFVDGSQLQHYECWCRATATQLGVSSESMSSFVPFEPQLLPP